MINEGADLFVGYQKAKNQPYRYIGRSCPVWLVRPLPLAVRKNLAGSISGTCMWINILQLNFVTMSQLNVFFSRKIRSSLPVNAYPFILTLLTKKFWALEFSKRNFWAESMYKKSYILGKSYPIRYIYYWKIVIRGDFVFGNIKYISIDWI